VLAIRVTVAEGVSVTVLWQSADVFGEAPMSGINSGWVFKNPWFRSRAGKNRSRVDGGIRSVKLFGTIFSQAHEKDANKY
jgi:hypothetical protein